MANVPFNAHGSLIRSRRARVVTGAATEERGEAGRDSMAGGQSDWAGPYPRTGELQSPGSKYYHEFPVWESGRWPPCPALIYLATHPHFEILEPMRIIKRLAPYADLIPIAFVIALTFLFSVEAPVSDDWDLVPVIQKMRQGTLDWETLDTPYAGHKIVVPYLALGGIAVATGWNTDAFRIFNLLIFGVLWLAIRPMAVREGRLLETAVVFWSWNQWLAWIFTAAMFCTMAVFCVVWSLRLLASGRSASFVPAMILAVVGTFCHGTGLAVWPAAFYLMFFTPRPLWQRIAFGAAMGLALYLFLQHPAAPVDVVRGRNYLQMPFFLLQAIGAPLGFAAKWMAALVSLGGLVVLATGVSWEKLKARPFIVATLLAGLGMMGLLMIARGGDSTAIQATDSRYGTMAVLFWVAVVLLVDWTGWRRWVLALLLALCVIRSVTRIPSMVRYKRAEEAEARGLIEWTPDRFGFEGSQTSPAQLDADEQMLRQWHYSLFRNR